MNTRAEIPTLETIQEALTPALAASDAPYEVYLYEEADEALLNAGQIFDFARNIIPQN